MKSQKKIVVTFSDPEKALAVKNKLGQAGIAAEVVDESKLQKFIFLSKPLACDKVLVDEADFDGACAYLQAADVKDHILSGEVRCFQCGSPNVDYPQFTRNTIIPTCFGILLSALHLIKKSFYCRECHKTWPMTVGIRPRTDILNWPSDHRGLVKEERG